MSESSTPLEEADRRRSVRVMRCDLCAGTGWLCGACKRPGCNSGSLCGLAEPAKCPRCFGRAKLMTPQLSDHEKRLSVVETNSKETHDTVIEIRTLLTKQISQQAAVTP